MATGLRTLALLLATAAVAVYGQDRPNSPATKSLTDKKIGQTEPVEMAKALVAQMASGQFDKAIQPFDDTMNRVLPSGTLKEAWDGVVKQFGPLSRSTETRTETIQQYKVVYVTCEFQRGPVDVKVVFTSGNKVTGLFFVPSGKYRPPVYADASKFDEEEVSVGSGGLRLPGTLSLPKGNGPFPALVLVHGSGPHDRDESLGPNKPFRDLAHGLASRGIAVLRYEKRTKHHQIVMALMSGNITVKEETVDDAVAAVGLLADHKKIDPKRIFVLGHSLGGMLIPRIAKAKPGIAGFISLAGSTRPLEDLVLEQTKYILSLEEKPTEEGRQKLREIERQVARVKSADLSPATPRTELPFGAPAKYWLDLRGYDPAGEAKDLRKPMLILQGERDYQVTMVDFANWKRALSATKDVKLVSYSKLNHLFMEGEGKSTPAEYAGPGNVAAVVIEEIANWVGIQGRHSRGI
jgi:dienelactone hydrolase